MDHLNIFILCLNDAKKKTSSKLEIYSFKYLESINQKEEEGKKSVDLELDLDPTPTQRRSIFHSCLGGSSLCGDHRQSVSVSSQSTNRTTPSKAREEAASREPVTERLLEFVFSSKIRALSFHQDLIILGFKDGKIETFQLKIEPAGSESLFTGSKSTMGASMKSTAEPINVNILVRKTFEQNQGLRGARGESELGKRKKSISMAKDVTIES